MADHDPIPGTEQYSFCESSTASSLSRWHIRKLDETGKHCGGGITTPSLCGLVRPYRAGGLGGWDLEVAITEHHVTHACPKCWKEFLAQNKEKPRST